jgi:hypothetical protein
VGYKDWKEDEPEQYEQWLEDQRSAYPTFEEHTAEARFQEEVRAGLYDDLFEQLTFDF